VGSERPRISLQENQRALMNIRFDALGTVGSVGGLSVSRHPMFRDMKICRLLDTRQVEMAMGNQSTLLWFGSWRALKAPRR